MKKMLLVFLILAITISLSACTVNWFGDTIDVSWYFIVIPIVLIAVVGYFILLSKTFICPYCKTEFKVKPYQLYVTIHMCKNRLAKCPRCGKKGFCKVKR
jgi:hypothetical protein